MIRLIAAAEIYYVGRYPLTTAEDLRTLKLLPLLGYSPDELWLVSEQEYTNRPGVIRTVPARVRECYVKVTICRPNTMRRKVYRRRCSTEELLDELSISLYPAGRRAIKPGAYRAINPWLSLREVNDFRKDKGLDPIIPPKVEEDDFDTDFI